MLALSELRERKLGQWAITYLAAAWLLLQAIGLIGGYFAWPALVGQIATVLFAIGFLGVLILAWYHGEKGQQRVSGPELVMIAALLLIAGIGVAFVTPAPSAGPEPLPPVASAFVGGAPVAEQGSIAVLPFENMSADADNEYFSDGITEELLNVLAQLPELRVASRTSAFAFKGKDVAIDSIARALNVRHVLEGSVRKAGDQVRITAQLIDAESGYHLWSGTYDRKLEDIFAVQDEISREIVQQLQLQLGGGRAGARLAREETKDPDAHVLVLRAAHLASQNTREGFEQAEALLKQAIGRDPTYARAHSLLANVYSSQAYRRYGPVETLMRQARAALERGLELDPNLPQAHYVAGVMAYDSGDRQAAAASYARAVELNPGYAAAHSQRAWVLMSLGRREEAIQAAERAVQLDPVSFAAQGNAGGVYSYARQFQRAIQAYQSALELEPDHSIVLSNLALTYSMLGRHAEAIRAAGRAREASPQDQFTLSAMGYAFARAGRRADSEAILRTLEALPEPSPYLRATVYAGLGDKDEVFSLLEQAVLQVDPHVADLGVDPVFDPFRSDPRMGRLLQRQGLPVDRE